MVVAITILTIMAIVTTITTMGIMKEEKPSVPEMKDTNWKESAPDWKKSVATIKHTTLLHTDLLHRLTILLHKETMTVVLPALVQAKENASIKNARKDAET